MLVDVKWHMLPFLAGIYVILKDQNPIENRLKQSDSGLQYKIVHTSNLFLIVCTYLGFTKFTVEGPKDSTSRFLCS